jgi:putative transposase
MNYFTTNIINCLMNSQDFEEAISQLFRIELQNAMNELLKLELSSFLQYEKYDRSGFNSGNSRNGYYERELNTSYGTLKLTIPRDRNGEFSSPLVPKYERRDNTTEEIVIKLFQTGLTNDEIATIVDSLYSKKYSKTTISNITDQVIVNIDKFKSRHLEKQYSVIYLDATCIPIRRDNVAKEAVHIAVGVKMDGYKEILGYSIAPTESCGIWDELLKDLQTRGLEQVLLFVTDGLTGVENVILNNFPKADIQRCIVHLARNICFKVRVKDRSDILGDFKEVYTAPNKNEAIIRFHDFCTKWSGKYPKVIESLNQNQFILTFYNYPEQIRPSIYTTNLIEGINKQIKRKTKRKEQFPSEESLEKFLVALFEEFNIRYSRKIHKGFGLVALELTQLIEKRYQ